MRFKNCELMKGIFMLNSCSIYLSFLLPVILFSVEIISFSFLGIMSLRAGNSFPLQGVVVVS